MGAATITTAHLPAYPLRLPSTARAGRRRRAVLLAAAVLTPVVAVAAVRSAAALAGEPASRPERRAAPTVVVVQPGDTLWSLAERLQPDGDPRALVDRLAELNGGASLRIGQQLVVP